MLSLTAAAQENEKVSVEKSIFGAQVGLIGFWVNNECRLGNQFALRSEIGLELGVVTTKGPYEDTYDFLTIPNISLEPRWYYNLEKRSARGKSINNNSGNFFTIKLNFNPNTYLTSTDNDIHLLNQLGIFPKWGIRRVYGEHFTFETGIGVGPVIYFGKTSQTISPGDDVTLDLHLRIGYCF